MEKKIPLHLQEIVFGSSDVKASKLISKLVKNGDLRKIGPRLYTGLVDESPALLVRRNLFKILGHLYPGCVISHRSAFEFQPTANGQFFVTYKYTRKVNLPGVTLRLLKGAGPIEGDNVIAGQAHASQLPRAFLENFQISKQKGADAKILPREQIEERLEEIVRMNGEEELNQLRDEARHIAEVLGMQSAFERLNKVIGSILSTQSKMNLESPLAKARADGQPYDLARYELFELLFHALRQKVFKNHPEQTHSKTAFQNVAFFESYFSNYIEGTKFEVAEAKEIIRTQSPMLNRRGDSHDVLGTYRIVSNQREMNITPKDADALQELLQYRHEILLAARIEKKPGQFKTVNNFAGQTAFVAPDLVSGTLRKGFEFYAMLSAPFARAAFMMFLVSEVHPFLDGNGRIARVMMNAEFVKAQQAKIIIPTVFRDDYLLTLRRLTRKRDPDAYIKMLEKAHAFSATLSGENLDQLQDQLQAAHAFKESNEGVLQFTPPRY